MKRNLKLVLVAVATLTWSAVSRADTSTCSALINDLDGAIQKMDAHAKTVDSKLSDNINELYSSGGFAKTMLAGIKQSGSVNLDSRFVPGLNEIATSADASITTLQTFQVVNAATFQELHDKMLAAQRCLIKLTP